MVRYIVQQGDTLGTIAVKYGTSVQAIARANGIRNPNWIQVGQILRIPTQLYDDNNPHHNYHHYDDNKHGNYHHYDDDKHDNYHQYGSHKYQSKHSHYND